MRDTELFQIFFGKTGTLSRPNKSDIFSDFLFDQMDKSAFKEKIKDLKIKDKENSQKDIQSKVINQYKSSLENGDQQKTKKISDGMKILF